MTMTTTPTITGSSTNHQNSVQSTAFSPFALHAASKPAGLMLYALYDAEGRHFGGIYSPIATDGQLNANYAVCVASRPAHILLWHPDFCAEPLVQFGVTWMLPALPASPTVADLPADVLGYLVLALDQGKSVALHAAQVCDINLVRSVVSPLLGGGRA